jgi:hypothetical protein
MLGMKTCLHLYLLGNNVINCQIGFIKPLITFYPFILVITRTKPKYTKGYGRCTLI